MTAQVHNYSTYSNHKCRCDICRAAWAQRVKQRRDARKEEFRQGVSQPLTHNAYTYANWGCRCEVCVQGWHEYKGRFIQFPYRAAEDGPTDKAWTYLSLMKNTPDEVVVQLVSANNIRSIRVSLDGVEVTDI